MEALTVLAGVVFVVWIIWRLGLFKPFIDLADSAQIASAEFSDRVFENSVKRNQEEAFTTEEMQSAVSNMAMKRAFKEQLLNGDLVPKVKLKAKANDTTNS